MPLTSIAFSTPFDFDFFLSTRDNIFQLDLNAGLNIAATMYAFSKEFLHDRLKLSALLETKWRGCGPTRASEVHIRTLPGIVSTTFIRVA
jgi:hypothetical protein